MSIDPTENVRRSLVTAINAEPGTREALVEQYGEGNVWDTDELASTFEVLGFLAPFVTLRRKSDSVRGIATFQHRPRFYFDFTPHTRA